MIKEYDTETLTAPELNLPTDTAIRTDVGSDSILVPMYQELTSSGSLHVESIGVRRTWVQTVIVVDEGIHIGSIVAPFFPYERENNSTVRREAPEPLQEIIGNLLIIYEDEVYEFGMESTLRSKLLSFIEKFGNDAVRGIEKAVINMDVDEIVAAHVLQWLGMMRDSETSKSRLWILEEFLLHSSLHLRNGAMMGLAYLDEPSAIPYLEYAVKAEQHTELQRDMKRVLVQLENTRDGISS